MSLVLLRDGQEVQRWEADRIEFDDSTARAPCSDHKLPLPWSLAVER